MVKDVRRHLVVNRASKEWIHFTIEMICKQDFFGTCEARKKRRTLLGSRRRSFAQLHKHSFVVDAMISGKFTSCLDPQGMS